MDVCCSRGLHPHAYGVRLFIYPIIADKGYAFAALVVGALCIVAEQLLTDGDSDNATYFEEMIFRAKRAGIEFLGIGIMDSNITRYLQEEECCVIDDLRRLAPEMFRMLRGKLFGRTG